MPDLFPILPNKLAINMPTTLYLGLIHNPLYVGKLRVSTLPDGQTRTMFDTLAGHRFANGTL